MKSINDFQAGVDAWAHQTFSEEIKSNKVERAMRFLEEAMELCQSLGLNIEMARRQMEYTFSRPIGHPDKETGAVMVTLAVLCTTAGIEMEAAGYTELQRVNTPEMIDKIRAKQVTKQITGLSPEELKEGIARKSFYPIDVDDSAAEFRKIWMEQPNKHSGIYKHEERDKGGNDSLIPLLVQAQIGTPVQHDEIQAHMDEYFKRFPSYEKKFTGLEWYHIFFDFSDKITAERDALQKFKDFVHKRLDDAGIEKEPNGEHSAAGCRIGDRLDIALFTTASIHKQLEAINENALVFATAYALHGGQPVSRPMVEGFAARHPQYGIKPRSYPFINIHTNDCPRCGMDRATPVKEID